MGIPVEGTAGGGRNSSVRLGPGGVSDGPEGTNGEGAVGGKWSQTCRASDATPDARLWSSNLSLRGFSGGGASSDCISEAPSGPKSPLTSTPVL